LVFWGRLFDAEVQSVSTRQRTHFHQPQRNAKSLICPCRDARLCAFTAKEGPTGFFRGLAPGDAQDCCSSGGLNSLKRERGLHLILLLNASKCVFFLQGRAAAGVIFSRNLCEKAAQETGAGEGKEAGKEAEPTETPDFYRVLGVPKSADLTRIKYVTHYAALPRSPPPILHSLQAFPLGIECLPCLDRERRS
jgi:hypothetical protein